MGTQAKILPFPARDALPQATKMLLEQAQAVLHDSWYWESGAPDRIAKALEIATGLARAAARTMRHPKGAA